MNVGWKSSPRGSVLQLRSAWFRPHTCTRAAGPAAGPGDGAVVPLLLALAELELPDYDTRSRGAPTPGARDSPPTVVVMNSSSPRESFGLFFTIPTLPLKLAHDTNLPGSTSLGGINP